MSLWSLPLAFSCFSLRSDCISDLPGTVYTLFWATVVFLLRSKTFFMQCFFFHPLPEKSPRNVRKTVLFFHTSHKSFEFAAFCCWGEVVVPSEPPVQERIRKTAKYCTIIMIGVEPENTEWTSATCWSIKIANICFVPVSLLLVTFLFHFLLW